jgi:hypothetical protein
MCGGTNTMTVTVSEVLLLPLSMAISLDGINGWVNARNRINDIHLSPWH